MKDVVEGPCCPGEPGRLEPNRLGSHRLLGDGHDGGYERVGKIRFVPGKSEVSR